MLTYTHETGAIAHWHGGEYIDVGHLATEYDAKFGYSVGEFRAMDCINVWDHENNCSRIPFTQEALVATVNRYIQFEEELEVMFRELHGEAHADD